MRFEAQLGWFEDCSTIRKDMNARKSKTERSGKPRNGSSKDQVPEVLSRQAGPLTLVVGLGKTGLSVARFLHAQGIRVAVTVTTELVPVLGTDWRNSMRSCQLFP